MFGFVSSMVLWGGRGTADKCHWHVWGALAVSGHSGFAPPPTRSRRTCFPRLHCSGSRLLYRERALSCRHFPGLSRSGSGSRVLHKGTDSAGPAFCAFPVRAAQAARSLTSALSLGAVCLIPSAVWPQLLCALVGCALCLFWESDFWLQPSWWMSTIQNLRKSLVRSWEPVCILVGGAVSGAECAPFPSPLPPPPAGDGPVCSC